MSNRPVLPPGEPTRQLAVIEGRSEPHWAVAILLDSRVPLVDFIEHEFTESLEYWPSSWNAEKALGGFDSGVPGWVPWWFPTIMHVKQWTEEEEIVDLTDEQRLQWFDKALAYYARSYCWPPTGTLKEMKAVIATSLLMMLCQVEQEEIPGTDRM